MKLISLATTTLLASAVSARSGFFGSSQDVTPYDDSLSVPGENPLQHCANPSGDILDLQSVDLDPNPPKAGQTLVVTAKGMLTKDVEDGAKVHLSVKYGLITIIRQTADLCENVRNVNLECPLRKDNVTTLNKEVDLPKEIPPGKYTVLADVVTKDNDKITCLTATIEFKRGGASQQVIAGWKNDM